MLGSMIEKIRKDKNITKVELSKRTKINIGHITHIEKGERNPKDDRTLEISKILNISFNAIKKYDFNNPIDLIYIFLWLEELIPNYQIDLSIIQNVKNKDVLTYKKFIDEWNAMRKKRKYREISYEEYIEWKLNFELEVDRNEWV